MVDDVIRIEPDAERVVYMDFLAFGKRNGKVKKRVAVRADEIESNLDKDDKVSVQFSMFE